MKKLILFFMMISVYGYGQITISYDDYQSAFSEGSVYSSYSTPIGGPELSVFVGEASGTPQYWDFSTYSFDYMARSVSVEPSTAPLINDFPSANIVLFEKGWISGSDTFYMWNYKELLSDKFVILGISDSTSVQMVYDPPAIHAVVPLTYGASWIRERDSTYIMPGYYTISESWVTVDAYGTMKLPSGEYSCLRLSQLHIGITHTPEIIDTNRTKSYHFYSKEYTEINLPSILEDQFELSTINISGVKYSKRDGQVGVPPSKTFSQSNTLDQNLPNPFLNKTKIGFNLVEGGDVVLTVYDFMGKEIKTLVAESMTYGQHQVTFDASGLPAGVYFYQLLSNGKVEIKKMIVHR